MARRAVQGAKIAEVWKPIDSSRAEKKFLGSGFFMEEEEEEDLADL